VDEESGWADAVVPEEVAGMGMALERVALGILAG
jgi:hypothetical protein